MRATIIILGLAFHVAHAGGNGTPPPDSSGLREQAADLDFLASDLANDSGKAPSATAKPRPARTWIFWAAAGAATCGGLGWYWYSENAKPATTRNEQVFTDAH